MTSLRRSLGLGQAVVIGLASMIGAGVFFVWAPAADAAGNALLIGLAIAACVAALNALSTAQLAMAHPVSGGSYAYARATVGPSTGFVAGALFLVGKMSSAAAIALVAGSYLWPEQARAVALLAVVVLAVINILGVRGTALTSAVIVSIVLVGLIAIVVLAVSGSARLQPIAIDFSHGLYGVLRAAGLLFFCFAGYARIATLGEEVRDPRRTLPRAIIVALAITLLVYAAIGALCLSVLGAEALAQSASPLAQLVPAGWAPVIRIVAGIASIGSLLGVLAALSRTTLAMARERDLPVVLARVSARTHSPAVAEAVIALIVMLAVVVLEPGSLVAFSSCAVLVYYGIAHLSALRQPSAERWLPRVLQYAGMAGCLLLAVTLPWRVVLVTAVVALGAGTLHSLLRRRGSAREN